MDDPEAWRLTAVDAAEQAITELMEEFKLHPFTHRCEHSLHVELYQILRKREPLSDEHEIGETGFKTRLVHKEWPSTESIALDGLTKPKRQSYDIGVLSPSALLNISTEDFRHGIPAATIAIELGLDYGYKHLHGDIKKLVHNNVKHAYIVHFSRVRTRQSLAIEELIRETTETTNIKTAFAHLDIPKRTLVCKTLNGKTFEASVHGDA
jgi:hypothetical protein